MIHSISAQISKNTNAINDLSYTFSADIKISTPKNIPNILKYITPKIWQRLSEA